MYKSHISVTRGLYVEMLGNKDYLASKPCLLANWECERSWLIFPKWRPIYDILYDFFLQFKRYIYLLIKN